MTEANQETKQTRKRRPKGQSMPVMKELLGLMDQRTSILTQIRQKKMELAQLESSMQALATEIQWRANIFGMVQKTEGDFGGIPQAPSFAPSPVPWPQTAGVILAGSPTQAELSQQQGPQPPQRRDSVNRAMVDLGSLS